MKHSKKILALWLATSHALASEPVALEQGERAPFAGILMPLENAAKLGERVESCELRLTMGERLALEKESIREKSSVAVLTIERQACDDKTKLLQKALADAKEAARREWWEQPGLLVPVGVIVGAGVLAGSVYLVGQLRPAIPQ